jgi:nifR3 family TIM-barrel protein
MAGVSNWPFRFLSMEEGAALTFSEMASAVALLYKGKGTIRLLKNPQNQVPFAAQLFGKDPGQLAEAAKIAEQEHGVSLIDLNFACPARKVVNSGHGAALLKTPDLCVKIAEAVAKKISVPLTIKTRPGFYPPKEGENPLIYTLAPRLEEAGIKALALHPRYASLAFAGEADWTLIKILSERLTIPLIGSGDITSPRLALERLKTSGASFVMLGRAVRGRPWLFSQCLDLLKTGSYTEKNLSQRLSYAVRHADLLYAEIGQRAVYLLRSVLAWYLKDLPNAASYRARICREEDFGKQRAILTEAFSRAGELIKT